MDKKVTIGLIVVVAVVIIVGALIAVGMTSNNNNDDGNKYVIYDGNGHNTSDGNATVKSSESKIPTISWDYPGYALKNYNDKKDGSGTAYNVGADAPYGKTLYAQYESATSVKVNLVSIPSYMKVKYNDADVTNGQIFNNDQCKFEFKITVDTGYKISAGEGSTFLIQDTAGDITFGSLTYSTVSYGIGEDVSATLLSGTVTIATENIKDLTIMFTAQS